MVVVSRPEDAECAQQVVASLCARTEDGAQWQSLSWPEQVVLLVYGAQGVIDNGGLVYFYEDDWPGRPPYSLFAEAYAAIGADEMAKCIAATAALFPGAQPHLDCEKRRAKLEELCADTTGLFMQCDDFAVGQGEQVLTLLAAYILAQGIASVY